LAGWIERSNTHRFIAKPQMGFAALNPSYNSSRVWEFTERTSPTLPRKGQDEEIFGASPTQSSGAERACGTFPAECCFQVIYFISNISFSAPS
jgi:hypothetical protein